MAALRTNIRSITVHPAQPARMPQPPVGAPDAARDALRIFASIPPRYGVLPVDTNSAMFRVGEVAVFDEDWTGIRQAHGPVDCLLEEGAIYVTEHLRPRAGMTWDYWWQLGKTYGSRSHLDVSRSIVRAARSRWKGCEDRWMIHPLAPMRGGVILCSDGPYDEIHLVDQIIGKVVGIYCPAAIAGGAGA